jgi:hypothetical protein
MLQSEMRKPSILLRWFTKPLVAQAVVYSKYRHMLVAVHVAVQKRGIPEDHFTPWKYITYVTGTTDWS